MPYLNQPPFVPSSIELVEMRPSRGLARTVSTRVLGVACPERLLQAGSRRARTLLDTNGMECAW